MKSWHILVLGTATLCAALLLPLYEPLIAGAAALLVVSVVALGFLLRPRRDVFYIRITVWRADLDDNLLVEHDQLAVKAEVARLWLLFLPTSLAAAFLVVTATNGTIWNFSLIARLFSVTEYGYFLFMVVRLPLAVAVAALWAWTSERWTLRDADASEAACVSLADGRVIFSFLDREGGLYGGESLHFGLVRPATLARLVIYRVRKPERNKIGSGLLFHRLKIVGRGLTELDRQTVATHSGLPETSS